MKLANDLDFLMTSLYLAIIATVVYAAMIFAVRRKVAFKNPLEMHFPRLWREHKRHFPRSRLRQIFVLLILAVVASLVLDRFR